MTLASTDIRRTLLAIACGLYAAWCVFIAVMFIIYHAEDQWALKSTGFMSLGLLLASASVML